MSEHRPHFIDDETARADRWEKRALQLHEELERANKGIRRLRKQVEKLKYACGYYQRVREGNDAGYVWAHEVIEVIDEFKRTKKQEAEATDYGRFNSESER